MKRNEQIIPIFFTIDNSYAPYLSVAIASLADHASRLYHYRIHIVYQELGRENRERLAALAEQKHVEIVFTEMVDLLKTVTDREENRLRCDYFTLTIYFRLFLADMFPEYDKGIYLDSDIVVLGDISELYRKKLEEGMVLLACPDDAVRKIPELMKYAEQAVGINRMEYFNSGILVMDMKLMREKRLAGKFLELLDTWHFDSIAPDQDYLNAMCYGRAACLDGCWDVMPAKGGGLFENPKLIHYNLFEKPWCYSNIQYEEYFWEYAKRSVYYPEILEHKRQYGRKQKERDQKSMELLIRKAKRIPDREVTFRKLYEKGVPIRL